MNNMDCADHNPLLTDERNAWAAVNSLKDSGIKDENELAKRYTDANDASARLKEHISACPKCQRKSATSA